MTKKWIALCWRVGVDVEQVEGRRCPECGDPSGHREHPGNVIKDFDRARVQFLGEVRVLMEQVQRAAMAAFDEPEIHDYVKHLATSLGVVNEAVARHRVLSFDEWKNEVCGGRRACIPVKDLEEH